MDNLSFKFYKRTRLIYNVLNSLKHPAKYIGKKPRKYIIPAKPLTPMHLQSLNANSPDETGKGSSRVTSNEQVHMYREMSSGALNRATYNKVRIRVLIFSTQFNGFIFLTTQRL